MKKYISKTEKRIRFRIQTRYYLELLMPEIMKLFGGNKSRITKDKSGENMLHLELN